MRLVRGRASRLALAGAAVTATALGGTLGAAAAPPNHEGGSTTTPIRHLVVLFQENVSFDHYFATYPHAANPPGEPRFTAREDTPSVNGLNEPLQGANNPNAVPPFRLDRSQYETSDQDHNYTDEQAAFDSGLMDKFVEKVGRGAGPQGQPGAQVMGYYDGNTVTGLWNYAQSFAMSDNSFSTVFGPSTPGALNLVSGQTHGFSPDGNAVPATSQTVIGDPQPAGDACDTRDRSASVDPSNRNIGDLLNARNVSWGWFQGGFRNCAQTHANKAGVVSKDYIPHHEPFQYYASTANPAHTPPASVNEVGHAGPANHQYDLTDFWSAVDAHNMPSVSFLKAPAYQDGHAGYSDPLDEQEFLVNTINRLERTPYWHDTAVVIAYDDSDGWYDHQMSPIVNHSQDPAHDALRNGAFTSPTGPAAAGPNCGDFGPNPNNTSGGYQDRCGYGPRQPLLVVSPYAKHNFVDHSTTDQSSILRFIEDNWQTGRVGNFSFDTKAGSLDNLFSFHGRAEDGPNKLFLDPETGQRHGNGGRG